MLGDFVVGGVEGCGKDFDEELVCIAGEGRGRG